MEESIKKIFAIDASFLLSYLLPDEKKTKVDDIVNRYIARDVNFVSTDLLPFEVLNSLHILTLRRRLTTDFADELTKLFFKLDIICYEIDMYQTFKTAQKNNITVYDASYLCLAKSKNIPLLTLDEKLKKLL